MDRADFNRPSQGNGKGGSYLSGLLTPRSHRVFSEFKYSTEALDTAKCGC